MNTVYIVHVLVAVILLLCTKTSSSGSAKYLSKDGKMIRCIAEERKALLLLFKQDVANKHNLLPSWKKEEEEDCCKWKGVVCDNHTSHVTQLHLSSLIFPFNPYSPFSIVNSLLDVPYINYLDLSNNHYLAEIPTFIGSLRNLVHLDLSNTSVIGSIPYQIGNLSNLQYLNLSHNYLYTIPESIGSLNSLTYLDLSYNEFDGLFPHELKYLSKLHHLDLGYNSYYYKTVDSQFFEWLFNLSSLTYLDLSDINFDIGPTTFWSSLIQRIPSISVLRLNNCSIPPSSTISNFSSSITELHLHGNFFNSSIFHWLSHFRDSLIVLDLSLNILDGRIPDSFALMSALTYLDLSANQLNGPIPLSFGNMTALTYLDLYGNQLNGSIPESFGNITALTDLDLSENQLNGVLPQSIFDFSSLEFIDFSENNLTGSLPDFTHLSSLRDLKVNSNQLNGYLPTDFEHHSALQSLNLSGNYLRGPLPDFTGFSSLVELYLDNNAFSGSVPDFTGCLSLQELRLDNNKLTEWKTQSTGLLSSLVRLDLSMNSIDSTISEVHLSNVSSLENLNASFNSLKFELDSDWLPSFQLKYLSLASCKLGPKFPNWIRNQGSLDVLDISNSQISDIIPLWFWNISVEMTHLNLSSNKIRGKFLPKYVYILEIDLSSNYFDGPLPAIREGLSIINLSQNKFSGTLLSLSVSEYSYISFLDISHNQLVGAIPDYWMHFQDLMFLNLGYNSLTGRIPKSMGNLVLLQTLILRNNKLYGELPSTLRNCSRLGFVDFGLNKLSGMVPSWIGEEIPTLYALILKSNRFYGRIPREICYLSNIHFLDLSINRISGTIPPCFGNLTAMIQNGTEVAEHIASSTPAMTIGVFPNPSHTYYDNVLARWKGQEFEYGRNFGYLKMIDLSTNNLTGEIPIEITRLVELNGLNLSGNAFYGKIPSQIGQLKKLESLDLSTNRFSGKIPPSMSGLTFLAYLNISNNNFWGRIPSGTQFQTFNISSYEGNSGLCGKPLTKICPGDEPDDHVWPSSSEYEDKDGIVYDRWFYISGVLGFSTTFWGIIGTLVLNRRWRHAYFLFLTNMKERLYVAMAVRVARLQRKN